MQIRYIDRKTGKICLEKVYGRRALSLLYGDGWVKGVFAKLFLPFLANVPFFSWAFGYLQKLPSSRKKVDPFIKEYGIDKSEFVKSHFSSFNDFFIRKLKPETRSIDPDPNGVIMPADGRYLVYPEFESFFFFIPVFCKRVLP